jgi:hypothetical protein
LTVGEPNFILETENVQLRDASLQLGLRFIRQRIALTREIARPSLPGESRWGHEKNYQDCAESVHC